MKVDREIFQFNSEIKNHASALVHMSSVDKYFEEERPYGATVGPVQKILFDNIHYYPLMARAKPDGGTRVIIDLYWPINGSVNSCVHRDVFDDIEFILKYPTIDCLKLISSVHLGILG